MPFYIVRNDIVNMQVEAIVNPANSSLLGGGGADGAIHRAAGPKLLEECRSLNGCAAGDAKITKGYDLFAKYVIHTVGPIWNDGQDGEEETLRNCYKKSLSLAKENNVKSIAFPLISSGVYGYPKEDALKIAKEEIIKFLDVYEDMTVYMVIFDPSSFAVSQTLEDDIEQFIDNTYVQEHAEPFYSMYEEVSENRSSEDIDELVSRNIGMPKTSKRAEVLNEDDESVLFIEPSRCCASIAEPIEKKLGYSKSTRLDDEEFILDEGFSDMLLRKIDENGMTDVECYKKANIDKKLFSKIRSNPSYRPSKATVCAFIFALELSEDEADELLMKAGFSLSNSFYFDVIIKYFLKKEVYDIYTINDILFKYDQQLLGSK